MPDHVTVPRQVTVRKRDAQANGHSASDVHSDRDAGKFQHRYSGFQHI